MNPPWIEFPHIPRGRIGWRMGAGEGYWNSWVQWYTSLSSEEQTQYKTKWPEPEKWVGFYDVHAPRPPLPNEEEITDIPRLHWMLMHYLKPVGAANVPGAEWSALYIAPNGEQWTAIRKGGRFYAQRHRRS